LIEADTLTCDGFNQIDLDANQCSF